MNKTFLRSGSLILAIVLAFGIFIPGRATSQNAVLMPDRIVNLAFFYKPPSNSDAATVASKFGTVVLTGGDENFRNQLTTGGFSSTVPQYFRADGIQDPGNCTSFPANNQIAYKAGDFCDISQNHTDWFLLDTNGNRMRTSPTSNYYRMDPGNIGWRNFFVSRLVEMNQQKGWSGVFLDNLEASLSEIQRDGLMPARYPDNASYQTAVKGFANYLYQNYGQVYNSPVVANIIARSGDTIWFDYMQSLNGAMQERWAVGWNSPDYVSESKWKSDLLLAENTQSQGKFIILVAQGDETDTNRQKFAFASYLLISNGKAAFRYCNEDVYNQVWLYDNYNVQLGAPLRARYQTGTAWRRDFTNGYVIVDPVAHTATISTAPATAPTPTTAPTQFPTNTPTRVATEVPTATTPTTAPTQLPTSTLTRIPTGVPTTTTTPTTAPTQLLTTTLTGVPTVVPTMTATPASAVTVYNDQNAAFVYSSGWTQVTDSQSYEGEFKLTQIMGSYVTVTFSGQKFSVIYTSGPLFGKMDVYVDGSLVGTINQHTSAATFQQKWSYAGTLAAGTHQLKLVFVRPSTARASIDAVSVP